MFKTDELTIEHLDFDFAPPCEATGGVVDTVNRKYYIFSECENVAEWRMMREHSHPEKDRVLLACTKCKDAKLNAMFVSCPICFKTFSPASTAYISVEPL